MIEDNEYKPMRKEPKRERTKEELEASRKLENELNAMDFRPHGVEW